MKDSAEKCICEAETFLLIHFRVVINVELEVHLVHLSLTWRAQIVDLEN